MKDLNENSVRQVTYQAELAAWLKANTEHADLMNDPEGKVDGSVEGREEERGPRRCPAPAALCR